MVAEEVAAEQQRVVVVVNVLAVDIVEVVVVVDT